MSDRSAAAKRRKQAVNVSISVALIEEARTFGTNISAVLEEALEAEHLKKRRSAWREENHAAIAEANKELATNGLWSDGLRLF